MIYTAGYAGHQVKALVPVMRELNAWLLDIRHSPTSRMAEWNRKALLQTFGPKYFHAHWLGNVNHGNGGAIQLLYTQRGLEMVKHLSSARNLILLCGCPKFEVCHRRTVAELLKEHGLVTQELAWPRSPAPPGTIPTLSLHQPWATLMALGIKRLETRGWPDAYRGPLVIHATKSKQFLHLCYHEPFCRVLSNAGYRDPKELPLMAALGKCDLVDVVPTEKVQFMAGDIEHYFGDYAPGRFAWVTANMRAFPQPITMPGSQGLWNCKIDLDNVYSMPPLDPQGKPLESVTMYFAKEPLQSKQAIEEALAEQRAREATTQVKLAL